jgi:hypothetical protein
MRLIFTLVLLAASATVASSGNVGRIQNFTTRDLILVACDRNAAAVCQQQAHGCDNLCNASNNPKSCHDGCMDRYKDCKVSAGCGDY